MREAVPDGFAFAVFGPGTLDLISGSGGASNELGGKLERRELRLRIGQFADEAMTGRQDRKEAAAPRAVERNSRRLKLFRRLTEFLLDYGGHKLEWRASDRRPNNTSRRIRMAPIVMAESATLNAGQGLKIRQGRKRR